MRPKPTFTRAISEREWSLTILSLSLFFGVIVRILPAMQTDFPINDGGMFAVMIADLISNDFSTPLTTTYNNADIPFAYPPLGFYIGAFFLMLGMEVGTLFLWLPALFSIAILPVFYAFAVELLNSRPHAATATAFLALAPGTYVWYLMGGGLTRALGAIFFLTAMTFTLRVFRTWQWKATLLAALFCGLTLLTHPQAALLTLTGCAVLWLLHGYSSRGTVHASVIVLGAGLVSAPWWAGLITRHGFTTLISGSQSGSLYMPLMALFNGLTVRQTILPFSTFFWLLGLGWVIYRRRIDLLMLATLLYFIDQRSAPAMSFYIHPLLAAYGFMDVLPSMLTRFRETEWAVVPSELNFQKPAFSLGLLGILFYLFVESAFHANVVVQLSLSSDARMMMNWVKENASSEDRFLIITGREDAMTDPVQEWFPAVTGYRSESTLQGLEWTLAKGFNARWDTLNWLQACEDAECVFARAGVIPLEYTKIIVDVSQIDVKSFEVEGYMVQYRNGRYVVLDDE